MSEAEGTGGQEATTGQPTSELLKSVRLMCAVATADGEVADAERAVLLKWARRHDVPDETVEETLRDVAQNTRVQLPAAEDAEKLFKTLISVAVADQELDDKERALLSRLGKALKLDEAKVGRLLNQAALQARVARPSEGQKAAVRAGRELSLGRCSLGCGTSWLVGGALALLSMQVFRSVSNGPLMYSPMFFGWVVVVSLIAGASAGLGARIAPSKRLRRPPLGSGAVLVPSAGSAMGSLVVGVAFAGRSPGHLVGWLLFDLVLVGVLVLVGAWFARSQPLQEG